jgi:energy-coupling factor transport system ATP-binding protein
MGLYPAQKIEARIGNCAITASTERWVWQRELWGRKAGMVFQHADEALNLQATVQETFTGLPEKFSDNEIKDKMRMLFSDSNIDAIFNKKVTFLSGGQKQRLNLLRVLMLAPELVILDEPLNGLDFESIKNVLALLEEQRRLGCALLMISHNEEIFDALIGKEHVYYLAQPRFSV